MSNYIPPVSIFNQPIKFDARSIPERSHGWWSVRNSLGGMGVAFGMIGAAGKGPTYPKPNSPIFYGI